MTCFFFFYIGETCELSNTNSFAKSPCRMPCEKDDDCINHGRHTCCPTPPGSSCMAECLRDNLKSNGATKSKCSNWYRNGHSQPLPPISPYLLLLTFPGRTVRFSLLFPSTRVMFT